MKKNIWWVLAGALLITCMAKTSFVWAESKYSIKQMTPDVEEALENRKSRYGQLVSLFESGDVGENNNGYVQAFSEEAAVLELVEAENHDRKVVYQAIADQNGLTDAIETIEEVFAQVKRNKAESGFKIQLEDGTWTTK